MNEILRDARRRRIAAIVTSNKEARERPPDVIPPGARSYLQVGGRQHHLHDPVLGARAHVDGRGHEVASSRWST